MKRWQYTTFILYIFYICLFVFVYLSTYIRYLLWWKRVMKQQRDVLLSEYHGRNMWETRWILKEREWNKEIYTSKSQRDSWALLRHNVRKKCLENFNLREYSGDKKNSESPTLRACVNGWQNINKERW